jgi:methyltransferase family protein
MTGDEVERWTVGGESAPEAGKVVALRALAGAGDWAVPFHEVAAAHTSQRAPEVEVRVPGYRGKRLLPVLSWLVTGRLALPGASASWRVERRHGPGPAQQALAPLGWRLRPERSGRWLLLHGTVPEPHELPPPRSFGAGVGARTLRFEADYGVFSAEAVDPGSALLLEVASGLPAVKAIADVGTGYGALAICLLVTGRATRAAGTEVDSIAAWLAERNAAAAGVELRVRLDPDPLSVERTPLTVCNVPTHLDAAHSAALMRALAARARDGGLVTVVHARLEDRYRRHLELPGLRVSRHAGGEHVVLEAVAS